MPASRHWRVASPPLHNTDEVEGQAGLALGESDAGGFDSTMERGESVGGRAEQRRPQSALRRLNEPQPSSARPIIVHAMVHPMRGRADPENRRRGYANARRITESSGASRPRAPVPTPAGRDAS